jgi:hypothetical protein
MNDTMDRCRVSQVQYAESWPFAEKLLQEIRDRA